MSLARLPALELVEKFLLLLLRDLRAAQSLLAAVEETENRTWVSCGA